MSTLLKRHILMSKENNLQTPVSAIEILTPYLKKFSVAWECASGEGNIAAVLRSHELYVFESDILNGIDFLSCEELIDRRVELIITNPPFNLKDKFLKKCFDFWDKHNVAFALLLPTTALGGARRGALYSKYGLEVLVPNKRVNFIYNGAKDRNWFHSSWFCKGVLPEKLLFTEMESN